MQLAKLCIKAGGRASAKAAPPESERDERTFYIICVAQSVNYHVCSQESRSIVALLENQRWGVEKTSKKLAIRPGNE